MYTYVYMCIHMYTYMYVYIYMKISMSDVMTSDKTKGIIKKGNSNKYLFKLTGG